MRRLFANSWFVLSFALLLAPRAQAQSSGLVGRWKLDESSGTTAFDASGRGNNGTLVNTPARITPGFRGGSALSFDGINRYVDIGDVPDLKITGALTLSAWFKTTEAATNYRTIVSKWFSGGGAASYSLAFNSGGLYFSLENAAGSTISAQTPLALNDGNWHHAAGTWDGSAMHLYVDGIERASNSAPAFGLIHDTTYPVRIGTDARYATDYNDRLFRGSIDDVRIYNVALTGAEVTELYTLVAWWPGEGNANDAAGSFDGTLHGGTTFTAGAKGSAFSFDGIDDFVDAGAIDAMDGQSKLTITFWANFVSLSEFAGIVSKAASDTNRTGVSLDSALRNGIDEAGLLFGNGANTFAYTNANVAVTNEWHHWAAVFDGTQAPADRLKFYFDGTSLPLSISGTLPATTASNSASLTIGQEAPYAGRFVHAAIDEVRIYDAALTQAQVAALVSGSSVPISTTTALNASPSPSSRGQSVTFTATVTKGVAVPDTPTGSITFFDGVNNIGTVALNASSATLQTSALAVGTHSITAVYSGDSRFRSSTSTAFAHTVAPVVPGPPTGPFAVATNAAAQVTFTAPTDNGGSPIIEYRVLAYGGASGQAFGPAPPIWVTNLMNGEPYTFVVNARNAAGWGPASVHSNEVTPQAPPTNLYVTKTADTWDGVCNSDCSLRDAVYVANRAGGGGAIIHVPAGTYALSIGGYNPDATAADVFAVALVPSICGDEGNVDKIGDLDIGPNVTIEGDDASTTIIDIAREDNRAFDVYGSLNLEHVTITNSRFQRGVVWGNTVFNVHGGASLALTDSTIRNAANGVCSFGNVTLTRAQFINGDSPVMMHAGVLTVVDSTFDSNDTWPYGGAITLFAGGPHTITGSTFVNNTGESGGAVHGDAVSLTVTESTFHSNHSYYGGGAIFINRGGSLLIKDSTITANDSALDVEGVWAFHAPFSMANTIIASNLEPIGPPHSVNAQVDQDSIPYAVAPGNLGGNICSDSSCGSTVVSAANLQLGPLQDNFFGTSTRALLPGSPAIDAGVNDQCSSADQRHSTRPLGARCDSGSFEAIPLQMPVIGPVSPTSAVAGSGPITITVTDGGSALFPTFSMYSVVRWNGVDRPTTIQSCFFCQIHLTATISAADLANAGSATVTVFTPTAGTTAPVTFTINNPAPSISSLGPSSTFTAAYGMTLTVNGTGFNSSSVVRINGSDRPTRLYNGTLQATLAAGELATAGTLNVTVHNPGPGGGDSNAQAFTIYNPSSYPTALSPSEVTAGNGAFTLTVDGVNFVNGSKIVWSGMPLTTTFISSTRLQALISGLYTVFAIPATVTVETPNVISNGGALAFNIKAANTVQSSAYAFPPGATPTIQVPQAFAFPKFTFTLNFSFAFVRLSMYNPVGITISGAEPGSSMPVEISYPLSHNADETHLALQYLDGTTWRPAFSSGGTAPVQDMTDTPDWAGKFSIVFDDTSTPRLTDMNENEIRFEARVDSTPPVITPHVSGPAGANGWYTGDVQIDWSVSEPDSPVQTNGCESVSITSDTNGSSYTCTATSPGGSATQTVTIRRDAHAPNVVLLPSALISPGSWTRGSVTVGFGCDDANGSGLAAPCPGPQTFTADGQHTAASGPVCDQAGNCYQAALPVWIDSTSPALATPSGIVATTNGTGATVAYPVSASDALSGVAKIDCTPAAGSFFDVGSTTVTCTATDRAGNTSSGTFAVNVNYSNGPVLSGVPDGIQQEAASTAGAAVTYALPIAVGGETVTCSPASGSTFALGTTTVTCSAENANGITDVSFGVIVSDTTAPQFSAAPPDIAVEASSGSGAVVSFAAPPAVDAVSGNRPVACTPAPGSVFAIGTTPVACVASDTFGNSAHVTFHVIVQDTTAPAVTVPVSITTDATGHDGAVVTYAAATATDAVGVAGSVSCAPASGTLFLIGTTTVTCSASDFAGNTGTATFTITVRDTPPVLIGMPADVTAEATSPAGAVVSYALPGAIDLQDPSPAVACAPASGSTFAFGTTIVTCSATDSALSRTEKTFKVTVSDTIAPSIAIVAPTAGSYVLSSPVNASYTCTDSGSGVSTCIGTVPNGAPIDTASIAPHTFVVNASDVAGNTSSRSVSYNVTYGVKLLFDPTKPMKSGSTAPIKLQLTDAAGQNLSSAALTVHVVSVVRTSDNTPQDVQDAGGSNPNHDFRYDASLPGYIFNLKTTGYAPATYVLRFSVTGDPAGHEVQFQVR